MRVRVMVAVGANGLTVADVGAVKDAQSASKTDGILRDNVDSFLADSSDVAIAYYAFEIEAPNPKVEARDLGLFTVIG